MLTHPARQRNTPKEMNTPVILRLFCFTSVYLRGVGRDVSCRGTKLRLFFPKQAGDLDKEKRNKEQVDESGRKEPARNGGSNRVLGRGSCAFRECQRKCPEEEGQRGHDDRAQPD